MASGTGKERCGRRAAEDGVRVRKGRQEREDKGIGETANVRVRRRRQEREDKGIGETANKHEHVIDQYLK